MNAFSAKREGYAVWVEALRDALACGDSHGFSVALAGFNAAHDSEILHAVRRVAGDLRAALEQFREDSRLADLAERQVPDARARLAHVLRLTDDAAHRTLDLVERSCPLAEEAARDATRLRGMRRRATGTLDVEVQSFLDRTASHMAQVRSNLSEVLMAQGYQDLSGQIIRGVINLVEELEAALGILMRLSGASAAVLHSGGPGLHGPAVPGVELHNSVSGQQDVDALLSGLGM
jgi:chemotaxis protein CheZ